MGLLLHFIRIMQLNGVETKVIFDSEDDFITFRFQHKGLLVSRGITYSGLCRADVEDYITYLFYDVVRQFKMEDEIKYELETYLDWSSGKGELVKWDS